MAIGISDPVNSGNQSQLQQARFPPGLGLPQSVHSINAGVCINTAVGSSGIGIYQGVSQNVTHQYPSATITTICFTDANGQNWALSVDPIYAPTLLQISQAHQISQANANAYGSVSATRVYSGPKPVTVKHAFMIEGDFTEGEMELAENLIAELEGGTKKGSKQNIQADIDCAA